ncbi:glycine/D-amino acid oxidase-like deaminating enzyme [Paraburkholderia caballeronis]|uniref:NAD(P)/FAD-dependent oxidoreductase n=1 Tax=Paraburkholderia caballeronis TaxID=416943 RepID=UPI0010D1E167|nr:FAD-dependent oxidoreductase [Paraburkholderia caballeronis]TDV33611.1 glycine/D-amino acid oxidase-like deaminating enzyme [Paraburkholderia caballeronis]
MNDVIVIGGGLAGCATAYYLAQDGVSVTVLERSELNTQASGSNAGSLHAQIPHDPFVNKGPAWAATFAPTIGLLRRSIDLWRGLSETLGEPLEVALKGGLLVATDDAQMAAIEAKARVERGQGLDVRLLGRDDVHALAPYLSDAIVGGAFCPDEGKANPLAATLAYARAAQALGARFERHVEVTGLARERDGFAVATTRGVLRARRVVNAAGASAGDIAALLGVPLDVQGFAIQVAVTERTAPLIPHLVYSAGDKLTLKQNGAGSVLIGGGWPARWHRRGHPSTDPDSLSRNMAVALAAVPALAPLQVVRTWAAVVNGTDDWKPILGEVPGVPGFFVNFFPWMGFTAGPAVARIVASLVQGAPAPFDIDLSPFLLASR